ncbi:MAG: hypothetical protein A3G49_04110 [Candidatus Sungbacteria bacterium RIFCSPLOWO2_12_FULL_41_11]|uniref:Glutamate dehydrogenase n=1 Tax=Candidatus Sungbacteria bacterium RIFCSPLOWO2_12_FULL_41_11 TaxID=1802286 RepID=A0A1G2LTB0_9BACT|nr:MAG: Glutamate dehydrogenase [Parcubacteria group bacterium GW2011_GWA2_42_14]OGZ99320.1 MAG: hypothetical protein A3D41_02580 [Candidatus Sungbacteria bacterium RIFCSPHIGHO2_02_FULL_41_12b]OHA14847.1 MAG: hypothetical protein A3G49_04110 [Candidatus Sungbacteria bacterium RIFCSPLOWO2_12_FULL_41_11]
MSTFLENTQKLIEEAADIAMIDGGILTRLKKPERILEFEITAGGNKFQAWRVQHSSVLGPYKGGIRFHPDSNLDEVQALAALMTLKTSLMGIPYGGGKGAVKVNPKELSKKELEELSRGYAKAIFDKIGPEKDIPAPDVGTDSQIMAWMTDEYSKIAGYNVPGVFTGKPIELGGSKGREIATSFGGFVVLREYLRQAKDLALLSGDLTVVVQGFGNVGGHIARILKEAGFKIVGVSDSKSAIYCDEGIDVHEIIKIQKEKTAQGAAKISLEEAASGRYKIISNKELLESDADILIPSALENQITLENAKDIKAKVVLELANGPITAEADKILEKQGIQIIPDILANGGGVVGSYFEWAQNLQRLYWEEEEVLGRLDKIMADAFQAVARTKKEYGITWRQAAYVRAIKRVVDAMKLRGRVI